jgi:hypothetical protein
MKRCVLAMLLAMMFLPAAAVVAQEPEWPQGPEAAEFEMEMRQREQELQQREHDLDMKRRMGELELEKRKLGLEHMRRETDNPKPHPLLLLIGVVHILAAVWVYQDIRSRNKGSGLWIVITLLTGLLGVLVYAIVRLGDKEK